MDAPPVGPPATDGDSLVVTTWYGRVRAYDVESGEAQWTRFEEGRGSGATVPAALGDDRVYVCHPDTDAGETTVAALNGNTEGETVWEQTVSGATVGPGAPSLVLGLTEDRVLYLRRRREDLSTMTTHLTALDRDSGEEQWTYSIDKHSGRGELTLTAESALFTADDRLHVLSLDGEKRWERPAQTVGHKPIVATDRLYLRALAEEYEDESSALVVYS